MLINTFGGNTPLRALCICAALVFSFYSLPSIHAQDAERAEEQAIILDNQDVSSPLAGSEQGESSIWVLLRVVLVLVVVCAAIYAVVYLLKKSTKINAANDPYLKSVASLPLAPNKGLQVITLAGRAFLIGYTDHSINLIGEIDDKELIDAMNLDAERVMPPVAANFASLLARFLPTPTKTGSPESAEEIPDTADFIKRQRERLRGMSGDTPQSDSSRSQV
ncbi:MAG TPA: flagellar biosynthetic protein FliO [Treponemataceae bacterium]|nr:flagellar biosynthetic protein FliO [Treponemataceae bacterium]